VTRLLGGATLVALVALAPVAWIAGRAWLTAAKEFHPQRHAVPWPASLPDVPDRQVLSLATAEGDRLRAWYLPSHNGAAVVLVHGTEADRAQLLPEGLALAAAGFGVLAYDQPGCGESGGSVTWGHTERAALRAAIDWTARQPGTRAVGVLAFSQGTFTAVQVASEDPRVRALALEGAVANYGDETRHEFRRWGWLSQWPAVRSREYQGYRPTDPQAEEVVGRIAPRPVLVVAGDRDETVPMAQAERVFRAAGEPKELWVVPGAAHGGYAEAAPAEYPARLVRFFCDALLP
jgi:pimeloyl-ACP methyl ester carboxylesterase